MAVREELQRAIRARGMKQNWLAQEAEIPEETLSRILTGTTKDPKVGTLIAIARAMNSTVGELLGERGFELTAADRALLRSFRSWIDSKVDQRVDARDEPNATRIRIRLADDEEIAAHASVIEMSGRVSRRKAKPPVEDARRNRPRGRAAAGPNTIIETDDPESPVREIPMHYYHELGAREVFKVEGDSMIDIGITPEDLVFIRPTKEAKAGNGKVVVCKVDGHEFVKVLDLSDSRIRLLSANASYDPMEVSPEEFEMVGVVVGRSGYVWMEGFQVRRASPE